MHADEIELDDALVRALLVEQFPQWSDLPLARIPDSGTDSAIYRLGDDMGVRLPRIHWAVGPDRQGAALAAPSVRASAGPSARTPRPG